MGGGQYLSDLHVPISKLILQIGWNRVHHQGMSKLCDDDMKMKCETINPLVYGKNKNNRKKRIGGEKARFKGRNAFGDGRGLECGDWQSCVVP